MFSNKADDFFFNWDLFKVSNINWISVFLHMIGRTWEDLWCLHNIMALRFGLKNYILAILLYTGINVSVVMQVSRISFLNVTCKLQSNGSMDTWRSLLSKWSLGTNIRHLLSKGLIRVFRFFLIVPVHALPLYSPETRLQNQHPV